MKKDKKKTKCISFFIVDYTMLFTVKSLKRKRKGKEKEKKQRHTSKVNFFLL